MRRTLRLLGLLLTFAALASAQSTRQDAVDMEIYADTYDRLPDGSATLSGNIVLVVNGMHVAADYGTFSPNWKRFDFGGGAVRITPGAKIGRVRMLVGRQHPRPVPAQEGVRPLIQLPLP